MKRWRRSQGKILKWGAINEVFYCFALPTRKFIALNLRLCHVLFVLCEANNFFVFAISRR